MKTKSLVLFLIFVGATSVFVCFFSNQRPTFQTIITETHKQLNNLKNLKENLRTTEHQELVTEQKYLVALGLTKDRPQSTNPRWLNDTVPRIVSAITPKNVEYAIGFIHSARHFLPEYPIHLYVVGLDPTDMLLLKQHCMYSNCTIEKFDLALFPSHVSDFSIFAHRPLLIQHALNRLGAILWIDAVYRLTTTNLDPAVVRAREHGVASWGIDQPTSALTHPRMFEFFHTQQQNFYFHRMVEPAHVVLFDSDRIRSELMLPWVQCSLIPECIAPIGAQSSGCRFDKKPLYRYSGCHRYDASAFNVVLGIMFNFNTAPYLVKDHVFLLEEELNMEDRDNTTLAYVGT